jgi:periplasmic copper chaperone A
MKKLIALGIVALAAACGAPPSPTNTEAPTAIVRAPNGLEIRDPWAAPTPGGVDVSAGYFTIANGGPADRLVAIASPRASRVEVHAMSMDGAIMRMRKIEGGLAVPASGVVTLAPGGLHLMFLGVTQPFAPGEEIAVALTFEHAGARELRLPVRTGATGH